eukprot:453878-Pyramimonas_sp.AAC.2
MRAPPQGADLIHAFAAAGVDRPRRLLFTRSGGGDGPLPAHLLPRNPMTYCTICSGTDIPSIAVAASVKAAGEVFCKLRQPGVPAPMFKQVLLCELRDDKRTFAMKASASSGHADCCAFKDAKDLAKTHAMCSRHGQMCPVPRAEGAWLFGRGSAMGSIGDRRAREGRDGMGGSQGGCVAPLPLGSQVSSSGPAARTSPT